MEIKNSFSDALKDEIWFLRRRRRERYEFYRFKKYMRYQVIAILFCEEVPVKLRDKTIPMSIRREMKVSFLRYLPAHLQLPDSRPAEFLPEYSDLSHSLNLARASIDDWNEDE